MIIQLTIPMKVDEFGIISNYGISLTKFNTDLHPVVNGKPCFCLFNFFEYEKEFEVFVSKLLKMVDKISEVVLDSDDIIATLLFSDSEIKILKKRNSKLEIGVYDSHYKSIYIRVNSLNELFLKLSEIN